MTRFYFLLIPWYLVCVYPNTVLLSFNVINVVASFFSSLCFNTFVTPCGLREGSWTVRGESSDAAPGYQDCVQVAGNGNLQLSSSKSSWFNKSLLINTVGSLYVISQNSVYERISSTSSFLLFTSLCKVKYLFQFFLHMLPFNFVSFCSGLSNYLK